MEGAGKSVVLFLGTAFTIIGLGGVPLAVRSNNMSNLALSTLSFFIGVGMLGWAYKE
jgi:hypothetical protein